MPSVANVSPKLTPVVAPLYGISGLHATDAGFSEYCWVEIKSLVVASYNCTDCVPTEFPPAAGVAYCPLNVCAVGMTPVAPCTKHVALLKFCDPAGIANTQGSPLPELFTKPNE